tara:strand:+ start:8714 stop:10588 length:1875 start_codon:yes stop_codon:yes gene_type:complete
MLKKYLRLGILVPVIVSFFILTIVVSVIVFKSKASDYLTANVDMFQTALDKKSELLELTRLIKGAELDVVSTQESLTDISATRGLDGLDDGFALAEESAAALNEKISEITELSNRLEIPSMVPVMASLKSQYDIFYKSGVAMSKAYIAGGPQAGNSMMAGFDEVAEQMQAEVDAMHATIDAIIAAMAAQSQRVVDDLNAQVAMFSTGMNYLIALVVIGGAIYTMLVSKWLLQPLSRLAAALTDIANGKLDVVVAGEKRMDEFGDLARSVRFFSESELKKRQIEADVERERGEREQEVANIQKRSEEEAELRMTAAMGTLAAGLKQLAGGNLSVRIEEPIDRRFESLREDFNTTVTRLASTLTSVLNGIGSMRGNTDAISTSANEFSKRIEQQAAALEQTAAALDQITANTANSAKRTEEARSLAAEANQSAASSSQIVSNAVKAMERIEGSSKQISSIISVIDEIAFQTNLLALNAGVEAARAGEAGKGFAVVAQEVRELAQRSANAAKEIKELIVASATEVSTGVKLVNETGASLGEIDGIIAQINTHMDAIATSTREQSSGLSEVNVAMNQMDQITQHNAATAEENTAATISLADEANDLSKLVNQFDLGQPGPTLNLRQVA